MTNTINDPSRWRRWFSELGMIPVLLLLCAVFSVLTFAEQPPTGPGAARKLAGTLAADLHGHGSVFIVVGNTPDGAELAEALRGALSGRGLNVVGVVAGEPPDAREAIIAHLAAGGKIDRLACDQASASWPVLGNLIREYPALAGTKIVKPVPYHWPNFLTAGNLLNIGNHIAVIAIIAVGMTMVIITGGIDLSVGSLIGLSSVVCAYLIHRCAGGQEASVPGMTLCALAGIATCAAIGLFSGFMVTFFRVPSFIVTLSMMLVASGLAFRISQHQTISDVPPGFVWLGSGATFAHLPNAVVLMLLLYGAAHILMSRTALGRYIYAVGGNAEAARLSGVPTKGVLLFVFALTGALAGLGGIVKGSTLQSGAATYGVTQELYVIAAVVVGGTSLAGGYGKVFGTLIGAFIIAVNDNGLNLLGVDDSNRLMVLGLVILAAVTFDRWRHPA